MFGLAVLPLLVLSYCTPVFTTKPNTPVLDLQDGKHVLKLFVNEYEPFKRLIAEVLIDGHWEKYGKFRLNTTSSYPMWMEKSIKKKYENNIFRIVKTLKDGTSFTSLPTQKEPGLVDTDITESFTPKSPEVVCSGYGLFSVIWKVPSQWSQSEDHVLVVEVGESETWNQTRTHFADADLDDFIHLKLETNQHFLRVKVLDFDYNFSNPSTEVDLTSLKGCKKAQKHKAFKIQQLQHHILVNATAAENVKVSS